MKIGATTKKIALALGAIAMTAACTTTSPGTKDPKLIAEQELQEKELPKAEAIDEFNKGRDAYARGELDEAIKRMEGAASIDDRFSKAYFNVGVIYEEKGDKGKAREYYTRAANASTRFASPHVNLGRMALVEDKTDEAWGHFQDALKEDPYDPQAHNNVSVMLRERKEYKEAVRHARRILVADSQNTKAYANLALIYYEMGLKDVSRLVVQNALLITEEDPDLWNTYGLIELADNDVTAAISRFRKALELEPDHVPALMNMGAIVLSVRDYERAISLFEKALEHRPGEIEAKVSIGVAKRGLGDLVEAERIYKDVLKEDPNNPLALFNLGILEQEHLAQDTLMGEGTEPPEDPVGQLRWNADNLEKAVANYERGREFFQKFVDTYDGDKQEYVAEASGRIKDCGKQIESAKQQAELLRENATELDAAMKEAPPADDDADSDEQ